MAFWTSQEIKRQQHSQKLIEPFFAERVKHGAYEMTLSHQVLTTPMFKGTKKPRNWSSFHKDAFEIPPGQFALLYTNEYVNIPDDVIAFISIKATVKLEGLINISGFHVDPGFSGRLKFSVYNAGNQSIYLDYGKEAFLIWFSDMSGSVEDPYNGNHKNQNKITAADRQRLNAPGQSPASLNKRIEFLELRAKQFTAVILLILVPIVIGASFSAFNLYLGKEAKIVPSTVTTSTTDTKLPSSESAP